MFEALDKTGASQWTTGLFCPPQPCRCLVAHRLTFETSGEIRKVLQHGAGCRQPIRHAGEIKPGHTTNATPRAGPQAARAQD